MSTAGRTLHGSPTTPESGRSPELTAKQRNRAGASSAAQTAHQVVPSPNERSVNLALDATGSAPLPMPFDTRSTTRRQLLTARAVADTLDVCTETVLRWIRNGELPAIRLPGGAIRINEADLHAWLGSRATPGREC